MSGAPGSSLEYRRCFAEAYRRGRGYVVTCRDVDCHEDRVVGLRPHVVPREAEVKRHLRQQHGAAFADGRKQNLAGPQGSRSRHLAILACRHADCSICEGPDLLELPFFLWFGSSRANLHMPTFGVRGHRKASTYLCGESLHRRGCATAAPMCILNALLFQLPLSQAGPHVVGVHQGPMQRKAVLPHGDSVVVPRHSSPQGCSHWKQESAIPFRMRPCAKLGYHGCRGTLHGLISSSGTYLPVPLQGAEVADAHSARPAVLCGGPPAHLARDHQLFAGFAVQAQPLELVQQQIFSSRSLGHAHTPMTRPSVRHVQSRRNLSARRQHSCPLSWSRSCAARVSAATQRSCSERGSACKRLLEAAHLGCDAADVAELQLPCPRVVHSALLRV